jgi:hypothetical protein
VELRAFREALVVGVRAGQRLNCPLGTLYAIRTGDVVCTGGAWRTYRYESRLTGEVEESARLERLVERWMGDLDRSAQLTVELCEQMLAKRARQREGGNDGR